MPDGEQPRRTTTRTGLLRTVLRRVVLGVFCCVVAVMVLYGGLAVISIAGLTFDPHGYTRLFGIIVATLLLPVALILWGLYRWLR